MRVRTDTILFRAVAVALGLFATMSGPARAQDASERPNIVLIYSDDLGYGDVGCYGATKVSTPNIDRLAAEGRKFTDAHSPSAVCTPSRYGLLTGQYGWRVNCWGPLRPETPLIIDTETLTVPRLLKQSGYATACIGKWHLGFGEKTTDWNKPLKPGPLEIGFDYYYGVPLVNSGPPFVYVENHHVVGLDPDAPFVLRKKNDPRPRSPTQTFPAKHGMDRWAGAKRAHELYRDEMVGTTLTEKAVGWMRAHAKQQQDKPFFMYLATTKIHHPFTPHPRFKGTSQCGRYGDFIHELDWIVGEVLRALSDLKLADNTLVIFTSDNGGMLNYGGQDAWKAGHRLNGDLLGFKFGVWEGGHRIPLVARWPGNIPAGTTSNQLIGNVDMLATLAALVDHPLQADDGPDSVNVLPAWLDDPAGPLRDHLILAPAGRTHLSIRKGPWVYIPARGSGGFKGTRIGDHTLGGPAAHKLTHQINSDIADGRLKKDAPPAQLYDLERDRSQAKNLIRERPDVAKQLNELLKQYQKQGRSVPPSQRAAAPRTEPRQAAAIAEPLPTFIVAGQSNAFRLGSLAAATAKGQPAGATVYYYANPQCTKAEALNAQVRTFPDVQPVHGSGAGIAWQLGREFPDGFAIIRYAICGSNLHTQWMPTKPDGYYRQYFDPFLKQGLNKIEQASGRKPQVMGMLWHQGESNSNSPETVEAFGRLMPKLVNNFQETYGPAPVVLGEIREFPDQPGRAGVNRQMHKIAGNMSGVAVAKLQDVGWQSPTNVHFSLAGAHEAGKRLVAAWKSQQDVKYADD